MIKISVRNVRIYANDCRKLTFNYHVVCIRRCVQSCTGNLGRPLAEHQSSRKNAVSASQTPQPSSLFANTNKFISDMCFFTGKQGSHKFREF